MAALQQLSQTAQHSVAEVVQIEEVVQIRSSNENGRTVDQNSEHIEETIDQDARKI